MKWRPRFHERIGLTRSKGAKTATKEQDAQIPEANIAWNALSNKCNPEDLEWAFFWAIDSHDTALDLPQKIRAFYKQAFGESGGDFLAGFASQLDNSAQSLPTVMAALVQDLLDLGPAIHLQSVFWFKAAFHCFQCHPMLCKCFDLHSFADSNPSALTNSFVFSG
jgi:hypothetical protein